MEQETVALIRQIIREAIASQQLDEAHLSLAEAAYARYCEDGDFEGDVKAVLDLFLDGH